MNNAISEILRMYKNVCKYIMFCLKNGKDQIILLENNQWQQQLVPQKTLGPFWEQIGRS